MSSETIRSLEPAGHLAGHEEPRNRLPVRALRLRPGVDEHAVHRGVDSGRISMAKKLGRNVETLTPARVASQGENGWQTGGKPGTKDGRLTE